VNFGTGKSSSVVEQQAFGVDPDTLLAQWEESLRAIVGMWQNEEFEFDGRFLKVPPTRIVPRPLQAPHPPLFAACTRPESVVRAGQLGLGALNFSFGSDEHIGQMVRAYRDAQESGRPLGVGRNNHFACTPAAIVLPNDREACEWGYRGARFFGDALNAYYSGSRPNVPLAVRRAALSDDELSRAMARRSAGEDSNNVLCGDPVYAREYVQRFRDLGVDELIFVMQMGTVPHEIVRQSILTFGEQVLPYVS
jgi:alkanesulfonate monooxygenase SsuD/methylene tetrahydromethanopterin reductase-like flavin-dependent oxidoreductase (luciferase family)